MAATEGLLLCDGQCDVHAKCSTGEKSQLKSAKETHACRRNAVYERLRQIKMRQMET